MATIDILPLNINGVKPPLNLLFDLFSKKDSSDQNLMYPIDLSSNPNYGHAIQFTVHESVYGITEEFNRMRSGGGILGQTFSPMNFKLKSQKEILSTISLYMPDTLNVDFNNIYADSSLEETIGPAKFLGGAIADFSSANKGSNADRSNFTNLYGKGLAVGAASMASGKFSLGEQFGSLVGNVLKTVPNPQLQLLFKGVGLRTFQFEFTFTPTSSKEAQMVEKIINAFQFYSSPALLGQSQQFLQPPQVFDINFAFTGGSGISGAVSSFFKNIGTNILTSQVGGALFGSSQIDAKSSQAKIFKIYHPCVLKDISIDYAPNGWAAYADGQPVQSRMTLTFQETDIVTKENIRPGYSPDLGGRETDSAWKETLNKSFGDVGDPTAYHNTAPYTQGNIGNLSSGAPSIGGPKIYGDIANSWVPKIE